MEINRIQPVSGVRSQMPHSQPQEAEQKKRDGNERQQREVSGASPEKKDVAKAIDAFNKVFESTHIQFTLHEESGEYYVQILNENDEVIKEIPSKKILDMVTEMGKALGLIIDKKV